MIAIAEDYFAVKGEENHTIGAWGVRETFQNRCMDAIIWTKVHVRNVLPSVGIAEIRFRMLQRRPMGGGHQRGGQKVNTGR